jgi:hypothetical protein
MDWTVTFYTRDGDKLTLIGEETFEHKRGATTAIYSRGRVRHICRVKRNYTVVVVN